MAAKTQKLAQLSPDEQRPSRDVTRREYAEAAALAGHDEKSIRLFLAPGAPVKDYVPVGTEFLRVIDW